MTLTNYLSSVLFSSNLEIERKKNLKKSNIFLVKTNITHIFAPAITIEILLTKT